MLIYECGLCKESISSKKVLMDLFIETDMYEEEKLFTLSEFPSEVKVDNVK